MTALRHEEIYGTSWSAGDDDVLRAGYGRVPTADLAARVGRGIDATRQRARVIGLAKPVAARITWTAEADDVLRAGYLRSPTADLAARLGTTIEAVWARARTLQLVQSGRNIPWTADEDRLVRELYGTLSRAELSARLGRTPHSVGNRLVTLGLTREGAVSQRQDRHQQEIAQLRAENDHLKHGALDAAHAPTADARRLAVLMAYRLLVIDAATAAVVLGVPEGRLPVEVGKAAKLGLDVARMALEEGR